MLMTRDISVFTYVTNRRPQALVSAKIPPVNSALRVRPLPQRTRGALAADGNDAPTASGPSGWASL